MRKEGDKLILSWEECHQPWKLVIIQTAENPWACPWDESRFELD